MTGKKGMSNTKRIVIGILILAIVGVCVYLSIQILDVADRQTEVVKTVRLSQLSMFEDSPILNKERIFYIPVLTTPTLPTITSPTTTLQTITPSTTTTAPLNVESNTNNNFVILRNYSDALI
jgi:hypothetical protein